MLARVTALVGTAALVATLTVVSAPAGAHPGDLGFSTTGVATGKDFEKIAEKDGGGEPSIAEGPGRTMYASFPSSKGMSFYRSFDNGKSFTAAGIADSNSGDTSVNERLLRHTEGSSQLEGSGHGSKPPGRRIHPRLQGS
jgi:hypothetical protein